MTAKEYAEKEYAGFQTYYTIAIKAFQAGLKEGIRRGSDNYITKLERELKELRQYHRDMERTLYNPEELGKLLAGL